MCYICLLPDRRLSMPQLKGGGRRRRRNNAGLLPSSGGHTRFWGLPLISVTGAETLRAGKLQVMTQKTVHSWCFPRPAEGLCLGGLAGCTAAAQVHAACM